MELGSQRTGSQSWNLVWQGELCYLENSTAAKDPRKETSQGDSSAIFFQLLCSPMSSLPHASTYLQGNRVFAWPKDPGNKKLDRNNLLPATVFNSDPYIFVYIFKCDRNIWNSVLKVNLFSRSRLKGICYRGQPHCAVYHCGTMPIYSRRLLGERLMMLKKQNDKNLFHW